ncbi:hypothetical protein R1flu_023498 [Riccia fluitans]|uniref:Uncharacterized protein n=1 Tax=Riccia fluitans TaxID=41844 RepID=A0ABD1XV70_9MARC
MTPSPNFIKVQVNTEDALAAGPSSCVDTQRQEKGKAPAGNEEDALAEPALATNEPTANDEERRGTKRKALAEKPKSRPKVRKAKNPTEMIDLSEEAKKEAESVLAEDTLEAKVDDTESFRLAVLFGSQTITNILQILAKSRTKVERVTRQRMSL